MTAVLKTLPSPTPSFNTHWDSNTPIYDMWSCATPFSFPPNGFAKEFLQWNIVEPFCGKETSFFIDESSSEDDSSMKKDLSLPITELSSSRKLKHIKRNKRAREEDESSQESGYISVSPETRRLKLPASFFEHGCICGHGVNYRNICYDSRYKNVHNGHQPPKAPIVPLRLRHT